MPSFIHYTVKLYINLAILKSYPLDYINIKSLKMESYKPWPYIHWFSASYYPPPHTHTWGPVPALVPVLFACDVIFAIIVPCVTVLHTQWHVQHTLLAPSAIRLHTQTDTGNSIFLGRWEKFYISWKKKICNFTHKHKKSAIKEFNLNTRVFLFQQNAFTLPESKVMWTSGQSAFCYRFPTRQQNRWRVENPHETWCSDWVCS